ncbi:MAG: VTT domain-containing protein [Nibricoccus sp.]
MTMKTCVAGKDVREMPLRRLTIPQAGPHGCQMVNDAPQDQHKRALLWKLAVVGVLCLVGVAVVLKIWSLHELVDLAKTGVDRVRTWANTVGPFPFFVAMALLPAVGFPISVFSVLAGGLFVPQIGLVGALACALLALGINIALTYWLARYALRPVLEALIKRLGYKMPEVSEDNHVSLTLLVRITPGPPYFVQGYLLGLAGVRFVTYLWLSWVAQGGYAIALVVFGDSLMKGNGKIIFLAVSLLVVVAIVIKMLRKRIERKKQAAA